MLELFFNRYITIFNHLQNKDTSNREGAVKIILYYAISRYLLSETSADAGLWGSKQVQLLIAEGTTLCCTGSFFFCDAVAHLQAMAFTICFNIFSSWVPPSIFVYGANLCLLS
jgi:hypothetical protein